MSCGVLESLLHLRDPVAGYLVTGNIFATPSDVQWSSAIACYIFYFFKVTIKIYEYDEIGEEKTKAIEVVWVCAYRSFMAS